jgi:hypothetical protein
MSGGDSTHAAVSSTPTPSAANSGGGGSSSAVAAAVRVRPRPINVSDSLPVFFLARDVVVDGDAYPDSSTPAPERERVWRLAAHAAAVRGAQAANPSGLSANSAAPKKRARSAAASVR